LQNDLITLAPWEFWTAIGAENRAPFDIGAHDSQWQGEPFAMSIE
jgi:hypothetical protein